MRRRIEISLPEIEGRADVGCVEMGESFVHIMGETGNTRSLTYFLDSSAEQPTFSRY